MIVKDKKAGSWVYHTADGKMHRAEVTKIRFGANDTVRELREALSFVEADAFVYTTETGITVHRTVIRDETMAEQVARVNGAAENARQAAMLELSRMAAKPLIRAIFAKSKRQRQIDALHTETKAIEAAAQMLMGELASATTPEAIADLKADSQTLHNRLTEIQAELIKCNAIPE